MRGERGVVGGGRGRVSAVARHVPVESGGSAAPAAAAALRALAHTAGRNWRTCHGSSRLFQAAEWHTLTASGSEWQVVMAAVLMGHVRMSHVTHVVGHVGHSYRVGYSTMMYHVMYNNK